MALTDQAGRAVQLGAQVGRNGGEGAVFSVSGDPKLVAKLYHEAPDAQKVVKLELLTQLASPEVQKFAAWPTGILYEGRKVRGFTMPKVQGKEIHQLFGPRERYTEFPFAKWDYLLRVSVNCAAAFDSIHRLNVVIGDVNEGNVLVTQEGLVRLIDCDSYQVGHNRGVHTCDVGIELWTPPELQSRNFRGLVRTPNHDRFGLAVLIFKMLFMGRHPFAGVPDQPGDFLLEKAIERFMFAFSPKARSLGVSPPGNCLALSSLPDGVASLFEAAFLRGSEQPNARPTAEQWGQALLNLEASLTTCSRDPAHRYPNHLKVCPWCAIKHGGGPDFFVSVNISANVTVGASNGTLWGSIQAVIPVTFTLKTRSAFVTSPVTGAPLPEGAGGFSATFVIGLCVFAISALLVLCGLPIGWAGGVIAWALLAQGKESPALQAERETREKALAALEAEMTKAEQELQTIPTAYQTEFQNLKQTLQGKFERYMKLDQEKARELQVLQANLAESQKRDFLDRQLISRASIEGIGPARTANLAAYGIESALDIQPNIRVPGIGATYTHRLIAWRQRVEAKFRFDPRLGVPKQELHQLDVKILDLRRTLEAELRQGQQALTALGVNGLTRVRQVENRLGALVQQHAKAKADVDVLP